MKLYIFVYLLSTGYIYTCAGSGAIDSIVIHDGKNFDARVIEGIVKKVTNLSLADLSVLNTKDKKKAYRNIKTTIQKSSKFLGSEANAYVNFIMQGVKFLSKKPNEGQVNIPKSFLRLLKSNARKKASAESRDDLYTKSQSKVDSAINSPTEPQINLLPQHLEVKPQNNISEKLHVQKLPEEETTKKSLLNHVVELDDRHHPGHTGKEHLDVDSSIDSEHLTSETDGSRENKKYKPKPETESNHQISSEDTEMDESVEKTGSDDNLNMNKLKTGKHKEKTTISEKGDTNDILKQVDSIVKRATKGLDTPKDRVSALRRLQNNINKVIAQKATSSSPKALEAYKTILSHAIQIKIQKELFDHKDNDYEGIKSPSFVV